MGTVEGTARFGLPQIAQGQAQKEVTHNEALAMVDGLLHPAVQAMDLAVPPSAPAAGQAWIVADGAGAAWFGRSGQLAVWTEGGWRFVVPVTGMMAWLIDQAVHARWTGSRWVAGVWPVTSLMVRGRQVVGPQHRAIVDPAGGQVSDIEGRTSIAAILAALRDHGLIAT